MTLFHLYVEYISEFIYLDLYPQTHVCTQSNYICFFGGIHDSEIKIIPENIKFIVLKMTGIYRVLIICDACECLRPSFLRTKRWYLFFWRHIIHTFIMEFSQRLLEISVNKLYGSYTKVCNDVSYFKSKRSIRSHYYRFRNGT